MVRMGCEASDTQSIAWLLFAPSLIYPPVVQLQSLSPPANGRVELHVAQQDTAMFVRLLFWYMMTDPECAHTIYRANAAWILILPSQRLDLLSHQCWVRMLSPVNGPRLTQCHFAVTKLCHPNEATIGLSGLPSALEACLTLRPRKQRYF